MQSAVSDSWQEDESEDDILSDISSVCGRCASASVEDDSDGPPEFVDSSDDESDRRPLIVDSSDDEGSDDEGEAGHVSSAVLQFLDLERQLWAAALHGRMGSSGSDGSGHNSSKLLH